MNIVYSSSNAYAEIAGTSIVSLFENNKDIDKINLYIIDNGINESNKNKLNNIAKMYNRSIYFLESIDIEKMSDTCINVGKWHISTFYRLFLSSILPSDIERVIYIDCDTLILKTLKELWDLNMNDKWVMGVDDCRGGSYRGNIGLNSDSIYINNGFLLIDLKEWRKNDVESEYIKFINKYKGNITYVDQGVLNGVLGKKKKIGLLPLNYNVQTVFLECSYEEIRMYRRPVLKYTKEEYEKGRTNPIIIHYTSFFMSGTRPWNKENNHKYREEFLKYRGMTNWSRSPLWNDNRDNLKKLMTNILNILPKQFMFKVVAIAHAKLYPMIRNIKMHYSSKCK